MASVIAAGCWTPLLTENCSMKYTQAPPSHAKVIGSIQLQLTGVRYCGKEDFLFFTKA